MRLRFSKFICVKWDMRVEFPPVVLGGTVGKGREENGVLMCDWDM